MKEAQLKYTKHSNINDRYKGWSKMGIRLYYKLIYVRRGNRNTTHNKEMEVKLKYRYKMICGKGSLGEGGADTSVTDVSDDEILVSYNDFTGDSTLNIFHAKTLSCFY